MDKQLYDSIIYSVAKTVKKAILEADKNELLEKKKSRKKKSKKRKSKTRSYRPSSYGYGVIPMFGHHAMMAPPPPPAPIGGCGCAAPSAGCGCGDGCAAGCGSC